MTAISQPLNARYLLSGNRALLLLDRREQTIYLRYTLIERETDSEIFPESLLDDWGHEIYSLELYEWIQENGPQFPRAEIFGFGLDGSPSQCFLRELDLTLRYPCYVYESRDSPLLEGVRIEAVLLLNNQLLKPELCNRPEEIKSPLRSAAVSWWRIPHTDFDNIDPEKFIQHNS